MQVQFLRQTAEILRRTTLFQRQTSQTTTTMTLKIEIRLKEKQN